MADLLSDGDGSGNGEGDTEADGAMEVTEAANVSLFSPPFLFALTPQPIPYYHFPFSRNFVNFLHTNNAYHVQCINKFK